MDIPGGQSGYTLVSQHPDDSHPPQVEPLPSEKKNRGKVPFDWMDSSGAADAAEVTDLRVGVRIGALFPSAGLQRQSSGSSFGESSLSGDYYLPTMLSSAFSSAEASCDVEGKAKEGDEAIVTSSSSKSWAQQAEEAYQLQLALALRLCSEASSANDPNYLNPGDQMVPAEGALPQSMSHRFWVNGSLSYNDKVPDGFYMIQGMDPFVWTLCTDVDQDSLIPTIESLKFIQPSESSISVIFVDRYNDPNLRQLHNQATGLSSSFATRKEIVEQIAKLVCSQMGGASIDDEHGLLLRWNECNDAHKNTSRSVVISLGKLSVGLCRHRALLFKILADAVHLPCRIVKGCKFCQRDESSSCLVRFGLEREYLVDLIGTPGFLFEPNSLINGPCSITILSPLSSPKYKSAVNFRPFAKQYFMNCRSLNLMFANASAESIGCSESNTDSFLSKNCNENNAFASSSPAAINELEDFETTQHHFEKVALPDGQYRASRQMWNSNMQSGRTSHQAAIEEAQLKLISRHEQNEVLPNFAFRDLKANITKPNNCVPLLMDDLTIPWSELVLKERIGAGSFGTVHRAEWHGSEVAVKILMEQDFHAEKIKEFLREVSIMKSLRHPNIVLFMGAVTQPPQLSIVTEYLSRGSLYRFLHKPGVREILDGRRRLYMAFDVAKGMNYLHKRNPPIVHRDLKSPNLLVDKKYTVKVCDFGLSRLKASTYLSSKSLAGTPEWMAPEVLRDEPSNEKSDVYSFGVILWELMTLQQPWSNLNPAQVVAAVGFKGRRLDIPSDVNFEIASIIVSCWSSEPWKRPSFSSVMVSLKQLLKPPSHSPTELLLIA
ncbi:Serine/threonine-protein kinase CTR1 [Platanthera guangdongensis]|uniref:Serine/threonine-protein kinase CTR1 n=1 Tax=Platanthera guangdongensis TaxID=2320717 RepID=A0ABR2N416_9ASPA